MNGETDKAYDRVKAKQERSEKAKGVLRGAGYARGGGVSPAKKVKVKMEDDDMPKKKIGKVSGSKTSQRADKYARGGSVPRGKHAGHHTKININVGAGQQEKAAAMQQGVKMGATMAAQKLGAGGPRPGAGAPPMARPPMPPPGGMGAPPPKPMMPPPGAGPGGPPPPMANRGGAFKRGGAVTNLTKGGGGGARGRLEKIAKYGTKPKA